MVRRFIEGILQSILATIVVAIVVFLIPAALMTHLARIQSGWTTPLLVGMCAGAMGLFLFVMVAALVRLPPRRIIPNQKNIEMCVRGWLDSFGCAIQNSPIPAAHFRLIVTVESGTKMIVGRLREGLSDYVQIRSELKPSADELRVIDGMDEEYRNQLINEIRLELARRNVGYSNLIYPLNDFAVFKRIPIRESLTEHEFVAAVDEVEAAVHSVAIVFLMSVSRYARIHLP